MFKKIEPLSLLTIFAAAVCIFFLPYMIESTKRNNVQCMKTDLEYKLCHG